MPEVKVNNIPVAVIDPIFLAQINLLKEQARKVYKSTLCLDEQRTWQLPQPFNWDLNLFHIGIGKNSISAAYDRTIPNKIYIRAMTRGPRVLGYNNQPVDGNAPVGEGRTSDCQAEKLQIDYLAIQERAFRLRHASKIRCAMHAAVRRRGHSTINDAISPGTQVGPVGGPFTTVVKYVSMVIRSGYNSTVAQPVANSRTPLDLGTLDTVTGESTIVPV